MRALFEGNGRAWDVESGGEGRRGGYVAVQVDDEGPTLDEGEGGRSDAPSARVAAEAVTLVDGG